MNHLVLSGTSTIVPSGTRSSCYRGPKSKSTPWRVRTSRSLNFTNWESFGFLLTEALEPACRGGCQDICLPLPSRRRPSDVSGKLILVFLLPRNPGRACRRAGALHSLPAKWSPHMIDHTTVELLWLKGRIENRIRFGHPTSERMLDRHRRVLSFAPGSIFAFVRWTSNDFGTVLSRIDIVRAATPGQSYSTLPWVIPGGESLLRLSGWAKVECVLQLIETIEGLQIDPVEAAPEYWHHVHSRLSVNEAPKVYTRARHQAWLHRRKVAS